MLDCVAPGPLENNVLTVREAFDLISTWDDLTTARRGQLKSALSRTARLVALPPDAIPLTPTFLRGTLLAKSASIYGLEDASMRTLLSGLRAVLRRLGIIDEADTPVTLEWGNLIDRLPEVKRAGLTTFARFCSATGTSPDCVDVGVLDAFRSWLENRTINPRPNKMIGAVRGAWNAAVTKCPGWPQRPLERPAAPGQYILPPEAFTEAFRQDLDAFFYRMAAPSLDFSLEEIDEETDGDTELAPRPPRPSRPSTIATRKGHCRWAASALVGSGVPIEEVMSLAALVTPVTRAQSILRHIYRCADNKPSAAGGHVADVLRMIAKYDARLPASQVRQIQRWSRTVRITYSAMTDKNTRCVRRMLEPDVEERYLELPDALMEAARQLHKKSRHSASRLQAARLAMRAVAISILSRIPLRVSNLVGLRLERHLCRSNPPHGPITHLNIPAEETKNRIAISVPVAGCVAAHIREWIECFRPTIAAPGCDYLFPGLSGGKRPLTRQGMGAAIKEAMENGVGVEVSPHQFRHIAAVYYLRDNPGHYEEVRQLLGHADIRTTLKNYCGVESERAVTKLGELLDERRKTLKPRRTGGPAPRGRKPRGKGGR